MPAKFLANPARTKGSNRVLIILIVVLSVLLVGGGIAIYVRYQSPAAVVNETPNTNGINTNRANTNGNVNANANANTNTANANTNAVNSNTAGTPTIVKGSLTDPETNEVVSSATLTIPGGALPSSVTAVAMTSLSSSIGAYASSKEYQAIGGVFIISPTGTKLVKEATIELSYLDSDLLSLGFVVKETDLTIASWNGTEWSAKNSLVDTKTNTVTTELKEFFRDGLAIVVPKPETTNTNTAKNTNTSTGVIPSLDSDTDGLTNQEEILYGTNAGSPDTDLDSFQDGQEVLSLYNPNGSGKLSASSLVKLHENTTYRYSIFSPPSWTVGTLNADKLVTFTSITGEFVQVSVQENTTKLSAREWYLSLNPSVDQSKIRDIAVSTLTGIIGPDGLNVYLADSASIYQITYNIGIKTEANYLTTFTMMYTSFAAGVGGNTNANTNGNSNENANANTNMNTNSNTNAANTNSSGSAGNSNAYSS